MSWGGGEAVSGTSGPAGARVLVVDDDRDLVESYRDVLELAGYEVLTALSGEAALDVARVEPPDVVLTDVSMPNMDGFELINRLRAELGGRTPPVVVCSAFDMTEEEAQHRGAELFLHKPATAAALVESVEALCHGARPDAQTLSSERNNARHERLRHLHGSEVRLRSLDRVELAAEVRPWIEWVRAYFDCGSAGIYLLDDELVVPLVVVGEQMTARPDPKLLHAMLAAAVETGTSLVVRDMSLHPTFRRALGPRPDIATFAGVPIVTTDGVRIGAVCLADPRPGRLDADSLETIEYLGRRGIVSLFGKPTSPLHALPPQAPLLSRRTFDTLLATELRAARRLGESVEVAIGELAPGISPADFAVHAWDELPRQRLALGTLGGGRVGVYARGPASAVRAHLAAIAERARSKGRVEAMGIAGIAASAGLARNAVMEIAESALSVARASRIGTGVERIVVRPESGKPVA
jgi:CheY-like chemotaxis protein